VLSPKKNALTQAIARATGDIIFLTDADCIVSPNWIRSHLSMYEKYPNTEMVVGFAKTRLSNKPNICEKFEHIDFLILLYAAMGAIQSGTPFTCSGQNLSYKRQSYYDVAGFNMIDKYLSGDDFFMMQKFRLNGKEIRFASYSHAFTETAAIGKWRELFCQRARWASNFKASLKFNPIFLLYLFTCFISFTAGIIVYPIKVFFDFRFVRFAYLEYYGQKDNLTRLLILWWIITPFYMLIVLFLSVFSLYNWKGRRVG
jgi:GT2 family glycosyltransferase